MPSDQKPASPEQVQLAEYQVWDRVERRLWSRARLILIVAVVLVLVVGLLGVPLALPAIFVAGPSTAALLIALSALSFLAAGRVALRQDPHFPDVPVPEPSLSLYAQVACDNSILAWMQVNLDLREGEEWRRISREVFDAAELYDARGWLEIMENEGGFSPLLWSFVGGAPLVNYRHSSAEIPAETPESRAMSKALRAHGFSFVGPTICYAFMQAVGMVNDHTTDCFRHDEV